MGNDFFHLFMVSFFVLFLLCRRMGKNMKQNTWSIYFIGIYYLQADPENLHSTMTASQVDVLLSAAGQDQINQ